MLLSAGADPDDAQDENGYTALMIAADSSYKKDITLLAQTPVHSLLYNALEYPVQQPTRETNHFSIECYHFLFLVKDFYVEIYLTVKTT